MKIKFSKVSWVILLVAVFGSGAAMFYKWQEVSFKLRAAQRELGVVKQEKQKLETDLGRLEKESDLLKEEVSRLDKEKAEFQSKFEETQNQLSRLQSDFAAANDKVMKLEKVNAGLVKEKQELAGKLDLSEKQRKELEEKFHSVKELKKAIHGVKVEISKYHARESRIRKVIQKNRDRVRSLHGNGGYTTRDYKPTYPLWRSQVNIEVFSAD